MSRLRTLATQTALYGVTYFAGRLLNFFLTPIYTRVFDQTEYGSLSLIYAYITFFNILYTYGLETGYFYFTSRQKGAHESIGGTAFMSMFYSSLFFSGILIAFSGLWAGAIGAPGSSLLIVYAGIILFFDTLQTIPFARMRRENKALRFAGLKILSIIINILFNFFFLFFLPFVFSSESMAWARPVFGWMYRPGAGVEYVFVSQMLSSGIVLLLLYKEVRDFNFRLNPFIWRNMLTYSWPLLILGFAGMINETLDRILLAARLPGSEQSRMAQVGVYSACYKLSIFMTLAVSSFRYAAEPFFFREMKNKDSKVLFANVLKYFSFVVGLIFLVVLFYLPLFIRVIGRNFREGLEVVPILLAANLFLGIFYYLSQWYKQTSRTMLGALIAVGGSVITLVINYIFIPDYGYMASAWATLCCYLFMAVASYALGQKYYPVPYDLGRISLYVLGAFILFMVTRVVSSRPLGEGSIEGFLLGTGLLIVYVAMFLRLERPQFISRLPVVSRLRSRREQ